MDENAYIYMCVYIDKFTYINMYVHKYDNNSYNCFLHLTYLFRLSEGCIIKFHNKKSRKGHILCNKYMYLHTCLYVCLHLYMYN